MVDSKFENHDNFVINDKYDDEEVRELDREDYYDHHSGIFRKKYLNPMTIGGAGLIAIIILLVIFLSGPNDSVDSKQLLSLEAKIQQLEQKLSRISEKFDGFNSSVTTQIDQIIKELSALHQKSSQTPKSAKTGQQETKPKFHQVRSKETLWGISRQYGLTIDQLRSYNNMGAKVTLQPGQRLKLTPN